MQLFNNLFTLDFLYDYLCLMGLFLNRYLL